MLRPKGFSIVELMVVMLILAVLLGVGAPAFLETVRNNRMITELYALRATLA
ncbi:MAG: prepilin-type N-terminal cleavage/methylation domain-containing protein, partial [Halioglobus sp.]|nr:prepilin-type N-terminal cleavage/methylation domain-containing protein [Halioglobus sp.]